MWDCEKQIEWTCERVMDPDLPVLMSTPAPHCWKRVNKFTQPNECMYNCTLIQHMVWTELKGVSHEDGTSTWRWLLKSLAQSYAWIPHSDFNCTHVQQSRGAACYTTYMCIWPSSLYMWTVWTRHLFSRSPYFPPCVCYFKSLAKKMPRNGSNHLILSIFTFGWIHITEMLPTRSERGVCRTAWQWKNSASYMRNVAAVGFISSMSWVNVARGLIKLFGLPPCP